MIKKYPVVEFPNLDLFSSGTLNAFANHQLDSQVDSYYSEFGSLVALVGEDW